MYRLPNIDFVRLFDHGEITKGDVTSAEYRHYCYRIDPTTKEMIITIRVSNKAPIPGDEVQKSSNITGLIQMDLSDLQALFGTLGLQNKEHCYISARDFTLHITPNGIAKLAENQKIGPALAKTITLLTLASDNIEEVAQTILQIIANNHPHYSLMNSSDNQHLIVKGECTAELSEQLLVAFQVGALKVRNNQKGVVETTDRELPLKLITFDLEDILTIELSQYMFRELPKSCKQVIEIISQSKKEKSKPKKRVGLPPESTNDKEAIAPNSEKHKVDQDKRKSFYLTAQNRLTSHQATPEDRELWRVLIRLDVLNDMDIIFPQILVVTLENKYKICNELEEFFVKSPKITHINIMNYLFELLNERKNDLNIHRNGIIDKCCLRENTDSWQTLFWAIRRRALEILKTEIQGKEDPVAIDLLNEYRVKDIFRTHIRNPLFLHVGNTNSVNEIEEMIKARRRNHVAKSRPLVRNV